MKIDVFLSICQTEVDGFLPTERQLFLNFFDQLKLADDLQMGTAWVAETHLSCQVQKQNPGSVIPHFRGEIGLNTDILQLAHLGFQKTKRINIGSAIRNIICNGGPIAHAEAVKTFLALHDLDPQENRKLELGFAAGRFPFSNTPYGFIPKSALEKVAWEVIKNKYFQQATEIFLRLLKGEVLSSKQISTRYLTAADFREKKDWELVQKISGETQKIPLECHWTFDSIGVVPFDVSRKNLKLTIGSHDPETQILANQYLPVGVFNLSITPESVIEETHTRMLTHFHTEGGSWERQYMPRTLMLFLDASPGLSEKQQSERAKAQARVAWENYWKAMEKTIDPMKVERAVSNTIAGNWQEVLEGISQKYHPADRLMLWFDFNNHDNEAIKKSMICFMEKVFPRLSHSL